MGKSAIPFNSKPYQDVSGISNSTASESYINGILVPKDTGGFISKRRPGLTLFKNIETGTAIDGVYWWASRAILVVVSNGGVYKITDSAGTLVSLGGVSLQTGTRVTFAEASYAGVDYIFMANGGQVAYTNGTAPAAFLSDTDAPTNCTFISFVDQYLVANDTSNDRFYYSDVGDPFSWSSLSFATAESNFDRSVLILIKNRNIVIFGEQSIEFWYNDGVTPFRRRNDTFISQGTFSPYSAVDTQLGIFFLNNNREVMLMSSTGTLKKVSTVFDRTFQGLSVTSNAVADNYIVGGKGFYVVSFPTDNKTYAYDYYNDYWAEWAYWANDDYARYLGNNYAYAAAWNKHIVGDYGTGKLYESSFSQYGDNGVVMKWFRRTGFVEHGDSSGRKLNISTTFRLKTGHSIANSAMPYYVYRRNPDGRGWLNERMIPAQRIGNNYPLSTLQRQGIYSLVQHEIYCTDPIDVELVEAIEEYDEL